MKKSIVRLIARLGSDLDDQRRGLKYWKKEAERFAIEVGKLRNAAANACPECDPAEVINSAWTATVSEDSQQTTLQRAITLCEKVKAAKKEAADAFDRVAKLEGEVDRLTRELEECEKEDAAIAKAIAIILNEPFASALHAVQSFVVAHGKLKEELADAKAPQDFASLDHAEGDIASLRAEINKARENADALCAAHDADIRRVVSRYLGGDSENAYGAVCRLVADHRSLKASLAQAREERDKLQAELQACQPAAKPDSYQPIEPAKGRQSAG